MSLLRIRNPNPKMLIVDRRPPDALPMTIMTLKTHEEVLVSWDQYLRLIYVGKRAIVILEAEGGEWDGEQWAQEIGNTPTAPDPEKAIDEGARLA